MCEKEKQSHDSDKCRTSIIYFTMLILPLFLFVTNILFITVGEARKVNENMEISLSLVKERDQKKMWIIWRKKPMKTEEPATKCLIKSHLLALQSITFRNLKLSVSDKILNDQTLL